jgi:hypothetical protein
MEALETRDRALMAKIGEVEGLAREAFSLPVAALREDVSLLREAIESRQRSWWSRRKAGKSPELEPLKAGEWPFEPRYPPKT